ncbi:MAG: hypothetical protein A2201_06115 [Alicyclobacillus sp. RIFOXYA1_FULL_53_8]|nr:MAG: hypothetical protein A2201_06115 [Alicyclobacillus sp. RIFOXYA1_FULL_53_8]
MELIQETLFLFRSSSFLEEQLPRWQARKENAVLRLILEPREWISNEELVGIFQATEGGETNIERAIEEGWLFPTTRLTGRTMYCIPVDLRERLRHKLVRQFTTRLETAEEGPLTFHEEGLAMIRDLDVFLEYVKHHEVKLTNDGSMYKKNLQQILELLEVGETPLQSSWRFGYGRRFHEYPDRFALLYDYAYQQRYIEEPENGFLRLTEASEKVTQVSALERQRSLIRFYLSLYRRPIPRLALVVQLLALVTEKWVLSRTMLSALESLVHEYYYDKVEQIWETRILGMMMHLGLIRTGTDENEQLWFQITKLGQQLLTQEALPAVTEESREAQRILIVQPNFEIVVTADQPLVTAELAALTELKQAGAVRVYRLTEETVLRGLSSGTSVSDWIEFIDKHSQTSMPGNVERTLREWEHILRARDGFKTS